MTGWNLVRWFLDSNLLVAQKLTLLNLQDQLTLDLILDTSHTRTFNFWSEDLGIDYLVNFHTAGITCINRNLHARFDICAPGHNTLKANERSNLV